MEFVAICSAALVFTLMLCIFASPLSAQKAKNRRLRSVADSGTAYFNELEGNLFQRVLGPVLTKLKRKAAANAQKNAGRNAAKKNAGTQKRERQLRAAGIYMSASTFTVLKLIISIALVGAALLITSQLEMDSMMVLLIVLVAEVAAMMGPDMLIKALASSRRDSMKKQLPDLMDILSVSIDAGLGFDAALKRALDRFSGALREELSIASMEISMGKPRREALTDMANRCDIAELRVLVAAIVQSEQMGTPIKNVLKAQSSQLRASRKQAAQEKGMKAPVKMMLPMVAFIFPVLLIILMGPTVLNIVTMFK